LCRDTNLLEDFGTHLVARFELWHAFGKQRGRLEKALKFGAGVRVAGDECLNLHGLTRFEGVQGVQGKKFSEFGFGHGGRPSSECTCFG
jgi:hypothetical protein